VSGADFAGAVIDHTRAIDLKGTPKALPSSKYRILDGVLLGPKVNLASADLTRAAFSNIDLSGADLTNTNLSTAILSGTILNGALLSGTNVTSTTLGTAQLAGVRSLNIAGTPLDLPDNWSLINGLLIGPGADLSGAHLENIGLSARDLTGVILTGAYVDGLDLSYSNLSMAKSGSLKGTPDQLPTDWRLIDGYLIGAGANLSSASLQGFNLAGMNLQGANFTAANLSQASFAEADLSGAVFSGGTNLTGAVLGTAKLDLVRSSGIVGNPSTLPLGWQVRCGRLVGPGADLSMGSFNGCSLKSANIDGAVFAVAGSTAVLSGVSSGALTGTPAALPSGWALALGYLIGPGADLRLAKLNGLNLTSRSLSRVKLAGANLAGSSLVGVNFGAAVLANTNLTKANITGADFSRSNLTGVVSGGLVGRPKALPRGWKIARGALVKG
jgi:uncharacterized protein YjbI with pentapeptide repeats